MEKKVTDPIEQLLSNGVNEIIHGSIVIVLISNK